MNEAKSQEIVDDMKKLSETQAKDFVRNFVQHEKTIGYMDARDVHNEVVWFMLFMRGRSLPYGTGPQTLPSGWRYNDIHGF